MQKELIESLQAIITHQEAIIEMHEDLIASYRSVWQEHKECLQEERRLPGSFRVSSASTENITVNASVELDSRDKHQIRMTMRNSEIRVKRALPSPVQIGPVGSQRPWIRQKALSKEKSPPAEDSVPVCGCKEEILAEETVWT